MCERNYYKEVHFFLPTQFFAVLGLGLGGRAVSLVAKDMVQYKVFEEEAEYEESEDEEEVGAQHCASDSSSECGEEGSEIPVSKVVSVFVNFQFTA